MEEVEEEESLQEVGGAACSSLCPPHSFIPLSSLLNPAAWMKGITTHLNNSAQHVAPPLLHLLPPTSMSRLPPTAGSGTSQPLSATNGPVICFSIHCETPPCDCRVGRHQAAPAPQVPFYIYSLAEVENICPQFRRHNVPSCTKTCE